MEAKEIKARYESAVSDRRHIESQWTDVEQYVLPYRGNFYRNTVEENSIIYDSNIFRYDDTAVYSAQTLAASIQGSLTSFTSKWFEFNFQNPELREDREARNWLQKVSDITYQELISSNFALETAETYVDIVGYGSSLLTVEQFNDDEGNYDALDFRSVPVVDGYFDEDEKGQVLNFYRKLNWTALQVIDKMGRGNVPDKILEMADADNAGVVKFHVVFCVYKRDLEKHDDVSVTKPLTPENRPYGYKYILFDSCEEIGEEGGYYEMPAFIARWRKTNDSKWGNSPAMKAMATIKTTNDIVRMTLTQLGKVINPPTLATERGLVGDLDIEEGGLTIVRSIDDVREYESKARFDVGEVKLQQLQASIREGFFIDQLQLKDSPAMTATEVQVRWQLMQRLLGPTMGRLESNVFSPMLHRVVNILARAGKFPDVPQVVRDLEADYEVEYIGPLPKAQRAQEVVAVEGFLADVDAMANIQERQNNSIDSVADKIDFDTMVNMFADMRGVPSGIIAEDTEVKRKRNEKRSAVQDQADAQQAQALSQADKNEAQAQNLRQVK